MPLTLTVLRCPENVPPETRTIAGGEFTVGRGPGVDWVLPDPERLLSKRHFTIAYRAGAWQIADTSTNGTTLNRDAEPIGHEIVRTLRDGDRLSLGAYEIDVRLSEDAQQSVSGGPYARQATGGSARFGDPFALDPLAPAPQQRRPFDDRSDPFAFSSDGPQLPPDFDPLAPDPNPAPFLGPTQEDHRAVLEDAFRPPSIGFGLRPQGKLPDDALLPDDWDKDLLSGIHPAAAAKPSESPPAGPLPSAAAGGWQAPPQPAARPSLAGPPPALRDSGPGVRPAAGSGPDRPAAPPADPFVEQEPPLRDFAGAAAQPAPTPFDEPFDLEPPPELSGPVTQSASAMPSGAAMQASAPVAAARQAAVAQHAASPLAAEPQHRPPAMETSRDGVLLAAFLQGAGIEDVTLADPVAAMRRLGAAFRAAVAGLRAVLIARASIKSEFRIEQTMIRARGNNPLKFSADDDDALAALLGTGRRSDMTAAEAVADALKDIKLHELASMSAMQAAVRTLLDGLDPGRLRAQAEQGGLSVLPAQRKARAWDAYEALHARVVQALADDFDSVFGKAFARAYERAMDDIAAEDK